MAFNKYFQDELYYLREVGAQFAEENPGLAKLLAEEGEDPDVDRLFEGFAFISGRIRQRLDDEVPEISHTLLELLWPNALRPTPSMSMLEFKPKPNTLTGMAKIKKHTTVQSSEVDGTSCIFSTCYETEVYPISISNLEIIEKTKNTNIRLQFTPESGVEIKNIQLDAIKLYLHDNNKVGLGKSLLLSFFKYLESIQLSFSILGSSKVKVVQIPLKHLQFVGFEDDEYLLKDSSKIFSGYRFLQEYFQFPEKYQFLNLKNLKSFFKVEDVESFTIEFCFSKLLTEKQNITVDNFKLNCTPIVNLFEMDATPVRKDNKRVEYLLRPGSNSPKHFEIFSVDEVVGRIKGRKDTIHYTPYESFAHNSISGAITKSYYKIRKTPAIIGDGLDHYIYLHNQQIELREQTEETVSVSLTCTNRDLAGTLGTGQIRFDSGSSPDFVSFTNITKATSSISPPVAGSLHWRLIASLALQYNKLHSIESIVAMIHCLDYAAINNRQRSRINELMIEGIEDLKTESSTRLVKGVPLSGLKSTLTLRESKFGAKGLLGESTMFLFASVLNACFTKYASVNSFNILEVIAVETGETYTWPLEI